MAQLTKKQGLEILRRIQAGAKCRSLARELGLARNTVQKIAAGTWSGFHNGQEVLPEMDKEMQAILRAPDAPEDAEHAALQLDTEARRRYEQVRDIRKIMRRGSPGSGLQQGLQKLVEYQQQGVVRDVSC